jgi:hypothetical protein
MHSVGRQDAIEMLACRAAELDERLVKLVLDRSAAGEQLVKRQGQPAACREAQPEVLLRWCVQRGSGGARTALEREWW